MTKKYVIYNPRRGRPSHEYYIATIKGLTEFINDKGCLRNLPDEESRNYTSHIESSYLSHAIWTVLTQNKSNHGRPYSSNFFYWTDGEIEEEFLFHFDIMHNPKIKSCGLANGCGSDNLLEQWNQTYHSIGNITPIPWFKVEGNHFIHAQALHNSLDERWDLFLTVLRNNWESWCSNKSVTFNDYMLMTCQHIYYSEIYVDFLTNIKDINRIELSTIKDWEKMSDKNPNQPLVSFSDSNSNNTNNAVKKIINLIKIRSHIIGLILKNTNYKTTL